MGDRPRLRATSTGNGPNPPGPSSQTAYPVTSTDWARLDDHDLFRARPVTPRKTAQGSQLAEGLIRPAIEKLASRKLLPVARNGPNYAESSNSSFMHPPPRSAADRPKFASKSTTPRLARSRNAERSSARKYSTLGNVPPPPMPLTQRPQVPSSHSHRPDTPITQSFQNRIDQASSNHGGRNLELNMLPYSNDSPPRRLPFITTKTYRRPLSPPRDEISPQPTPKRSGASRITPTKTMRPLAPSWHTSVDLPRAGSKRRHEDADSRITSIRSAGSRIALSSTSKRNGALGAYRSIPSGNTPKIYIAPGMIVKFDGLEDEPALPRMAARKNREQMGVKTSSISTQTGTAAKSARKHLVMDDAEPANTSVIDLSSSEESEGSSTAGESDIDELDELDASEPEKSGSEDDLYIEDQVRRQDYHLPSIEPLHTDPPSHLVNDVPTTVPTGPPDDLLLAIEALTLSSLRMQRTHQLPFLRRNLRLGFKNRCQLMRVPIVPSSEKVLTIVHYKYNPHNHLNHSGSEFEARMILWRCPLCDLHGQFHTREMLGKHLQWDHKEVSVGWRKDDTAQTLHLTLNIPNPTVYQGTPHVRRLARTTEGLEAQGSSDVIITIKSDSTALSVLSSSSTAGRRSPLTNSDSASSISSARPGINLLRLRAASTTPPRSISTRTSVDTRSRSTTTTSTQQSTPRLTLPSRYPTPPPESDPLGPSARYPYLPATSEYGGPTVYHSCLPGGPYIYDLLGTLPMERFGVLSWAVLDREGEIFESNDLKDEHKVMHALWARWIMLNRNRFVANYHKGMVAFVNEYWRMIHRAAGWDALRCWLLMMCVNRFLTGAEVAQVLRHYEGLTGMEFWYPS